MRWHKPVKRPAWMTREQLAQPPQDIVPREFNVTHQVLVASSLDHRRVNTEVRSALCGRRWNIDLDLRNIKTNMGTRSAPGKCHSTYGNAREILQKRPATCMWCEACPPLAAEPSSSAKD